MLHPARNTDCFASRSEAFPHLLENLSVLICGHEGDNERFVLRLHHVVQRDDVEIANRGNKDVDLRHDGLKA